MRHRFCVAAPGDYWSTTKLSDAMAAGGAGGCVPLIVLPRPREADAAAALPYAATLDYCTVAYLVTSRGASTRMAEVVERLRGLSAADVAPKRRALRHVRRAFLWGVRQQGRQGGRQHGRQGGSQGGRQGGSQGGIGRPRGPTMGRPPHDDGRDDGHDDGGTTLGSGTTLRGGSPSSAVEWMLAAACAASRQLGELSAPPMVTATASAEQPAGFVQLGAAGTLRVGGPCLLA